MWSLHTGRALDLNATQIVICSNWQRRTRWLVNAFESLSIQMTLYYCSRKTWRALQTQWLLPNPFSSSSAPTTMQESTKAKSIFILSIGETEPCCLIFHRLQKHAAAFIPKHPKSTDRIGLIVLKCLKNNQKNPPATKPQCFNKKKNWHEPRACFHL